MKSWQIRFDFYFRLDLADTRAQRIYSDSFYWLHFVLRFTKVHYAELGQFFSFSRINATEKMMMSYLERQTEEKIKIKIESVWNYFDCCFVCEYVLFCSVLFLPFGGEIINWISLEESIYFWQFYNIFISMT